MLLYLGEENKQVTYIHICPRKTSEVSTAGLYRFVDIYQSAFCTSIVILIPVTENCDLVI